MCIRDRDNIVDATAAAVCIIGLSGELAYEKILKNDEGTSMLRTHLIDFMSKIDDKILEEGAKFEIRQ